MGRKACKVECGQRFSRRVAGRSTFPTLRLSPTEVIAPGRRGCDRSITVTTTARTSETRMETRFACAVMMHLKGARTDPLHMPSNDGVRAELRDVGSILIEMAVRPWHPKYRRYVWRTSARVGIRTSDRISERRGALTSERRPGFLAFSELRFGPP